MRSRRVLGALLIGVLFLSGCNLLTAETLSFNAQPAGVGGDGLPETAYTTHDAGWNNVSRTVSAAGQEKELRMSNYVAEYRRELGDGDTAGFGVLSTPKAKTAGQVLNPLDALADEEILQQVPNPYGSLSELERQEPRTTTMLGSRTDVSVFRGVGEANSGPTDIVIELARIHHDGDIVVAAAVYPADSDESTRVEKLFGNVDHPLTAGGGDDRDAAMSTLSVEELNRNAEEFVGDTVRVEGYYSSSSVPLLAADYRDVAANTPMPENTYVPLALSEETGDGLSGDTEGYTVSVEAEVTEYEPPKLDDGDAGDQRVETWTPDIQMRTKAVEVIELEDRISRYVPEVPRDFITPKPRLDRSQCRFAVVISGGIRQSANYDRYWDGVVQTYQAMNGTYGVPDDNIYVNYWNGTGESLVNGRNIVDANATQSSVDSTFETLEGRVGECENATAKGVRSEVMLFTYNHGSSDQGKNLIGSQVLTPDELRDHLVELRIMGAEEINIMMMQCYSGHFIDLTSAMWGRTSKDSVTAIATAANNSEVSYGKSFGWEFVAALAKAYPNGTVVDADTDHNGEVTWNEAFVYAQNHDKYGPKGTGDEHPQYFSNARWLDPDGDGVHSNYDDKPHTYNPDQ